MQTDSYNKGGFYAFVFSMVFSLGFMAYIALFSSGIDLREIPEQAPAADQTVAGGESAGPAFNAEVVENPWVSSDELIAHGKQKFQTNCAVCHGAEGKGDGAAGAGLNPPPRNLVEGGWKQGGTSVNLFETLLKGVPGGSMASFAHLPKNDRWAMVHWIRSITNDKPADDAAKLEEYGKTAK